MSNIRISREIEQDPSLDHLEYPAQKEFKTLKEGETIMFAPNQKYPTQILQHLISRGIAHLDKQDYDRFAMLCLKPNPSPKDLFIFTQILGKIEFVRNFPVILSRDPLSSKDDIFMIMFLEKLCGSKAHPNVPTTILFSDTTSKLLTDSFLSSEANDRKIRTIYAHALKLVSYIHDPKHNKIVICSSNLLDLYKLNAYFELTTSQDVNFLEENKTSSDIASAIDQINNQFTNDLSHDFSLKQRLKSKEFAGFTNGMLYGKVPAKNAPILDRHNCIFINKLTEISKKTKFTKEKWPSGNHLGIFYEKPELTPRNKSAFKSQGNSELIGSINDESCVYDDDQRSYRSQANLVPELISPRFADRLSSRLFSPKNKALPPSQNSSLAVLDADELGQGSIISEENCYEDAQEVESKTSAQTPKSFADSLKTMKDLQKSEKCEINSAELYAVKHQRTSNYRKTCML